MNPSIEKLIKTALEEDIGSGDITTEFLVDPDLKGKGVIVAKESLVVAGLFVAQSVFHQVDERIRFSESCSDGEYIEKGQIVLAMEGPLKSLLIGERVALNFLQRLSGIATHVKQYADELEGSPLKLVDTRKTTPGLRYLEKYATRMGGAFNHRMGLFDGVLIKDNHIAACGGIKKAVQKAKANVSHFIKIEVEVTDLKEVEEALAENVDIVMLDNMDDELIKKAVKIIQNKALIEVSGGVDKKRLKALSKLGVNIVSVGALTHSARAVDLSMRIIDEP